MSDMFLPLTFGMPLTEQLRVALYPAIIERFTKGWVNLGASEKSWSLWVGGLYTIPEETDGQIHIQHTHGTSVLVEVMLSLCNGAVHVWSLPTCFLNVSAVFCVTGFLALAHQVVGKCSEDILIAHDEVRYDAVGSPVLIVDCKPLLHMNHTKAYHLNGPDQCIQLCCTGRQSLKWNIMNDLMWPSQSLPQHLTCHGPVCLCLLFTPPPCFSLSCLFSLLCVCVFVCGRVMRTQQAKFGTNSMFVWDTLAMPRALSNFLTFCSLTDRAARCNYTFHPPWTCLSRIFVTVYSPSLKFTK